MFEKMVIASELNLDMKNVVAPLVELQKMGAKECLILQCVKPQELNTDFRDMVLEWYKTNLDLERQMLLDLGFEVNNQLGEGHMRHEINRVAESEEASLIVVGYPAGHRGCLHGCAEPPLPRPGRPDLR